MSEVPGQMPVDISTLSEETNGTAFTEIDAICQPCRSDGEQNDAIAYCQICHEYFCHACLKFHRKQAMSKYHKILEGSDMPKTAKSNAHVVFCKQHSKEVVKFYCSHHNVAGCGDCIVLAHKACQVDLIQDVAETYFNGSEHTHLKTTADNFLKKIELLTNRIQTSEEVGKETCSKALADIKAFRIEVNDSLDKAEADLISELNKRKLQDDNTLVKLTEEGQATKEWLQHLKEKIHVQYSQAQELFLISQQTKDQLETIGDSIKRMLQASRVRGYEFEHSIATEATFTTTTPLGELKQVKTIAEMEPEFAGEIDIKTPQDTNHCRIFACDLISQGRLVVTDANNECVKVVDVDKRRISGRHKLESRPYGVTTVSEELVAVTLPEERKIKLLTVTQGGNLNTCAFIKLDGICEDIVYTNDTFILTMQDYVKVISITGQEIRTIFPSKRNNLMSIALASDSDTVYVSNDPSFTIGTTVHKVDLTGKKVGKYRAMDISQISGMAATSDGLLFVCNWASSNGIHVISPECKKIKEILKDSKHVNCPWCIAFCDKTNTLFLFNNEKELEPTLRNVLKVFKLK